MDINFQRFNRLKKKSPIRKNLIDRFKIIKIDLSTSIKPSILSPVCNNGHQPVTLRSKNKLIIKSKKRIITVFCLLAQFFVIIEQ